MAIISSFLCWSNTRTGSAVCGYYTLVISVVCLAFYMLRYIALDEMKDSIELKGIVYAGFVLYSFLIGVSLILLPGVYMDRKLLLLPWIYVLVITVLYETGAVALITTVHLEQDHTLNTWEIVAVAFYCLRLIANCYCFACVVSQYQELSEGRGTYEFLYKPRRRHMGRGGQGAPMSDLEEYNPPYGATLPPYSVENPYKEYSPPTYENLAIDYEEIDTVGMASPVGGPRRLQAATSASYLADVVVSPPPREFRNVVSDGENIESDHGGSFSGVDNPSTSSSFSARHLRQASAFSDLANVEVSVIDLRNLYPSHSMEELQHPQHHHHQLHHHRHHHHQFREHQDHHSRHNSHHNRHRHQRHCSLDGSRQGSHSHHRRSLDAGSAIAVTSSSACLLESSGQSVDGDSGYRSRQSPSQLRNSKTVPISPLTIQKRTYITWI